MTLGVRYYLSVIDSASLADLRSRLYEFSASQHAETGGSGKNTERPVTVTVGTNRLLGRGPARMSQSALGTGRLADG